jgi:hypothetical protein
MLGMSDSLLIFRLSRALPVSEFQTRKSLKRFLLGVVTGCVSLSIEKKDYPYSLVAITSLDKPV